MELFLHYLSMPYMIEGIQARRGAWIGCRHQSAQRQLALRAFLEFRGVDAVLRRLVNGAARIARIFVCWHALS